MKKKIYVLISTALLCAIMAGCVFAAEMQTTSAERDSEWDYTYLFDEDSAQKKNIPLDEVEHIAILFTSSPLPQSLFLDMEDMKSYYDPGKDIYYDIQVSKYINDLTDTEKNELEKIWQKGTFEDWDFNYEGFTEMDYECHLSIETEDEIYHYQIKGVDAPAPDSLMDFITELLHEFWDPEIISQ